MSIHYFDLTLGTPEENLALDEALLHRFPTPFSQEGLLRFWESPTYFVVLGVSGRLADEAHVAACEAEGVPILRRASGGGTVLQGPGCLNYSLILPHCGKGGVLESPAASYRRLLNHAVEGLRVDGLAPAGTSDLAISGKKVSGNAQKRTRAALLHHGTLLYAFDIARITRYLKPPPEEPKYRAGRQHGEFCRNFDLDAEILKERIRESWQAKEGAIDALPNLQQDVEALIAKRYGRREWTERF